ncbi:undifferentiated embryonic cell transcription factor 1 [Ctenodactylus gundi]
MLLRPRRPPPLAPPSPPSPDAELRPAGDILGTPPGAPGPQGVLAEPGSPRSPVSPGSAQRTPWSARETELLLGTLLQPTVWRSLLLDRRQALPTYRRVSAALARQQVRRTPAQCRRRYKFLKDKLRDAQGQPSGPFDAQIRELMGLLGDHGRRRARRRPPGPGRPQRGRRQAPAAVPAAAPEDAGTAPSPAAGDAASAPSSSPPAPRPADPRRASWSPTAVRTVFPEPDRAPGSPPPNPDPASESPDAQPGRPEDCAPPQPAPPSLNAVLVQILTHMGDILAVLGPLSDHLLTLNQHLEQLRGSFDQTVFLAMGFILGSGVAERGA